MRISFRNVIFCTMQGGGINAQNYLLLGFDLLILLVIYSRHAAGAISLNISLTSNNPITSIRGASLVDASERMPLYHWRKL
ncbi:MAG: hypothetical protein C4520_11240 [Candidatus Abyssobacteria bacterium SURF_5]|uniref:Uncharacterized protein n=1 Tax=Abyssobacteria bacterium (strain SURF_5) TaxID=2093360 RepID=A0A3A4NR52_ABYX5|nr:MAG: hypothetical protein C4520_11240 [Candidatus Abyssubacteria bacterium SURF_5]